MRRYALARPNARSSHAVPTPQGGGIAVILAVLLVLGGVAGMSEPFGTAQIDLRPLAAAVLLLAAIGAADDILKLPVLPRLAAQAVAVGAVVMLLPAQMRVLPAVPITAERGLEIVAGLWFVNLTNFMDGIDWMTVAETVPVTAAVFLFGLFGAGGVGRRTGCTRPVRRHAGVCTVQPAGGKTLPRRCRQPAHRADPVLAAA